MTALLSPAVSPPVDDVAEQLRAVLEQHRLLRSRQLDELAAMARAGAGSGVDGCPDPVAELLRIGAATALAEIQAALDRLGTGDYGRCEECRGRIASERLAILPMAGLCLACQRAWERHRQEP